MIGYCTHPYCAAPAVVYAFGHADRLTVVHPRDSRASLLAMMEQHGYSGRRCLQHAHDLLDELVEGVLRDPGT